IYNFETVFFILLKDGFSSTTRHNMPIFEQKMKTKPMTSTERCRKCRAKLKLDKSKHEQSKQKDRERKKRERAKQKEHARNNETLKRELKIRKCEEMQRYRAKKKQQKTHKTMNIVNSTARKMVISLKEKQAEDRKQRA
ncbi:hypothetical protein MAR_021738, partial [Mya arenaria]